MKYFYVPRKARSRISVFGCNLFIEYRPRLKTFDLIYYPNVGRSYGQSQFYDAFKCRHNDFTALMACIIKACEDYAESEHRSLYDCVKFRCFELTANESTEVVETPAHSSAAIG